MDLSNRIFNDRKLNYNKKKAEKTLIPDLTPYLIPSSPQLGLTPTITEDLVTIKSTVKSDALQLFDKDMNGPF